MRANTGKNLQELDSLDLPKLLALATDITDQNDKVIWDKAWEKRLMSLMTEIQNANTTKSPQNTQVIAKAYVELMNTIAQIKEKNL